MTDDKWTIWPINEQWYSSTCRHKRRDEDGTTCGHPAATGAPCIYCMCPIAVHEPVIKESLTTEEEDKP